MAKRKLTEKDFQEWGRKAGEVNKKKGKEYFSSLGKLGMAKRWANHKKKCQKNNI